MHGGGRQIDIHLLHTLLIDQVALDGLHAHVAYGAAQYVDVCRLLLLRNDGKADDEKANGDQGSHGSLVVFLVFR